MQTGSKSRSVTSNLLTERQIEKVIPIGLLHFQCRALIKQKNVFFLRHFIAKHNSVDMEVRFQISDEEKIPQKIMVQT